MGHKRPGMTVRRPRSMKARTKITGDAWVNGLSPCSRQVGRRLFEDSATDTLSDSLLDWKLCVGFEGKENTQRDTTLSQAPAAPRLPSSLYLFHSSQLSIKINSLAFRSLASIYLGWEDTHGFVAVPESPCSTFLISERSNQTR